jgi:hypothetical protein
MSLSVRYGFDGMTDPDAAAYVAAVEAADGQLLEYATGKAINDFVVGCKNDRIWTAIKASCILAGARTLAGALVPLVGTAPTNNNFVSGDYNRKTGLVGNGSTKYLDSNRNNNADPQNNHHLAAYGTRNSNATNPILIGYRPTGLDTGGRFLGLRSLTAPSSLAASYASMPNTDVNQSGGAVAVGATIFTGLSRAASGIYTSRVNGTNTTQTQASTAASSGIIFVFSLNNGGSPFVYADARLAFYSIGESLDLALLDTRVTTLMSAFAAAIP